MSSVKLNWVTPNPEWWMEHIARSSAPINQKKMEDGELEPGALLATCADRKHWSVFQHAYASVTVDCKLYVAVHLLRHQSFDFQMFSQRYAQVPGSVEDIEFRLEHPSQRQSSVEIPMNPADAKELGLSVYDLNAIEFLQNEYREHLERTYELYDKAIKLGIAKESAREILPVSSPTRIVMTGSVRSWIHFIQARTDRTVVQKETADVAEKITKLLAHHFPLVAESFDWKEKENAGQ